jgi:predicted transcriptional regulator
MEIRLPPDQEAHLAELAANTGRSAVEVAQEAITRFLDDETRFAEAVKLGIAAADRGGVSAEKVWEDAGFLLWNDTTVKEPHFE